MDRWEGKVALVTGASAGIGAAIAVELVKHGMKVVAVARRVERIEELKKQVEGATGVLYPYKCDVGVEKDIIETFQYIRSTFKTIHVLINNAGFATFGRLIEDDPESWRSMLNVNVIGLSVCTQQAFKLMHETGVNDGHIIHMNSISGHRVANIPDPIFSMYPATKHAVSALTETLRQELRFLNTKIKISSISPGIVETEFLEVANKESSKGEGFARSASKINGLKPKDIADAMLYVLSTPPHVQVHDIILRPIEQST